MRNLLLVAWLALLPAAFIYHLAAGEQHSTMDAVGGYLAEARSSTTAEDWPAAVSKFERAINELPEAMVDEKLELRLELAQAKMNASRLPEAHEELKNLLDELLEDDSHNIELENRVRESMAHSQFFMTWLMRLEGLPRDSWEPEIESARQNFRLLAERAERSGEDNSVRTQKENLEASIRLARLDLGDLQGLPIPSQ